MWDKNVYWITDVLRSALVTTQRCVISLSHIFETVFFFFFFYCTFHPFVSAFKSPESTSSLWMWCGFGGKWLWFLDVEICVWGEARGGGGGGGVSITVPPPHPANSDSAQRLFHLWPGPRNELWRAAASKNIRWLSLIIPRGYWDGWGKAFPRPPAERDGGKYLRSHNSL